MSAMSFTEIMEHLRMRCDSDIISSKAPIEAQPALISDDFPSTVKEAVIRELPIWTSRLLLQSCLDEIEWQTEERSKEACDSRRAERLC